MKIGLTLFFVLLSLWARENPFFPAESVSQLPVTSNSQDAYPPLKRAAITLPDQARVLQEVTVTYKTLDGSIESKSIQLEHAIDWHIPLFISQSYSEPVKPKPQQSMPNAQSVNFDFITLRFAQDAVTIQTEDVLLRHFMMVSPHRIILDFTRDANFLSFEKVLTQTPYKEVRIGNHEGYYRVVITLDGRYRFELQNQSDGYRLNLY